MIATCKKIICMVLVISLLVGMVPPAHAWIDGYQGQAGIQLSKEDIKKFHEGLDEVAKKRTNEEKSKAGNGLYNDVERVLQVLTNESGSDSQDIHSRELFEDIYNEQITQAYQQAAKQLQQDSKTDYEHFKEDYTASLDQAYKEQTTPKALAAAYASYQQSADGTDAEEVLDRASFQKQYITSLRKQYETMKKGSALAALWKTNRKQYHQQLVQAKQKASAQLDRAFDQLTSRAAISQAWQRVGQEWKETVEKEEIKASQEYIKELSTRIAKAAKNSTGTDRKWLESLAFTAIPTFELMGLASPESKAWALNIVRTYLKKNVDACSKWYLVRGVGPAASECQQLLSAVGAVAVLGDKSDSSIVLNILKKGRHKALGPVVIQQCGVAMAELGNLAALEGYIASVGEEYPTGFEAILAALSAEEWVDLLQVATNGAERWVNYKNQDSYYEANGLKRNAWTDLGEYLAEATDEKGDYLYRDQINWTTLIDARANGTLYIKFPAYVAGLLLGGADVGRVRDYIHADRPAVNKDGRNFTEKSNEAAWEAVDERLRIDWETKKAISRKDMLDLTGYALYTLYAYPKPDLKDIQGSHVALNNRLAKTYYKQNIVYIHENGTTTDPHPRRRIAGLAVRQQSAWERLEATWWSYRKSEAAVVDVVWTIVGMAVLGAGAVKLASTAFRALKTFGRAIRAAGRAGHLLRTTQIYGRFLRVGRLATYGTESLKQVYINRLANLAGVPQLLTAEQATQMAMAGWSGGQAVRVGQVLKMESAAGLAAAATEDAKAALEVGEAGKARIFTKFAVEQTKEAIEAARVAGNKKLVKEYSKQLKILEQGLKQSGVDVSWEKINQAQKLANEALKAGDLEGARKGVVEADGFARQMKGKEGKAAREQVSALREKVEEAMQARAADSQVAYRPVFVRNQIGQLQEGWSPRSAEAIKRPDFWKYAQEEWEGFKIRLSDFRQNVKYLWNRKVLFPLLTGAGLTSPAATITPAAQIGAGLRVERSIVSAERMGQGLTASADGALIDFSLPEVKFSNRADVGGTTRTAGSTVAWRAEPVAASSFSSGSWNRGLTFSIPALFGSWGIDPESERFLSKYSGLNGAFSKVSLFKLPEFILDYQFDLAKYRRQLASDLAVEAPQEQTSIPLPTKQTETFLFENGQVNVTLLDEWLAPYFKSNQLILSANGLGTLFTWIEQLGEKKRTKKELTRILEMAYANIADDIDDAETLGQQLIADIEAHIKQSKKIGDNKKNGISNGIRLVIENAVKDGTFSAVTLQSSQVENRSSVSVYSPGLSAGELFQKLLDKYKIPKESLSRDVKGLLKQAEQLGDAAVMEAIVGRVEFLLDLREYFEGVYTTQEKRAADVFYKVYYIGEDLATEPFNPQHMMVSLEEKLYSHATAAPAQGVVGNWYIYSDKNEVLRISWGKPVQSKTSKKRTSAPVVTPQDVAQLYRYLLGMAHCPQEITYTTINNGDTHILYAADDKKWLRIGKHETNPGRCHIHFNTQMSLRVPGGVFNGQENVIINQVVEVEGLSASSFGLPKATDERTLSEKAHQILVSDARYYLVQQGLAVPRTLPIPPVQKILAEEDLLNYKEAGIPQADVASGQIIADGAQQKPLIGVSALKLGALAVGAGALFYSLFAADTDAAGTLLAVVPFAATPRNNSKQLRIKHINGKLKLLPKRKASNKPPKQNISKKNPRKYKKGELPIPVFDAEGEQVGEWIVQKSELGKDFKLQENQSLKVILSEEGDKASLYLIETSSTRVRMDIPVQTEGQKSVVTPFGKRKLLEGLKIINNKLLSLYLLFIFAGMGNVTSVVANSCQEAFGWTQGDLATIAGISTLLMGLSSLGVGVLQNRWSRNKDGSVNDIKGRRKSMNTGLGLCLAAFLMPAVLGFFEPDKANTLKEISLYLSFALLGVGAAFVDVSLKPSVLAAVKKDDFVATYGQMSIYKQLLGNTLNYTLPYMAGLVLSPIVGSTIFFPVYTAATIAVWLTYHFYAPHAQTLSEQENVGNEKKLSLKEMFKQLKGKGTHNRIMRYGVIAGIAQGALMSTFGLYINNMFKNHYLTTEGIHDATWQLMAGVWFTLPIILGRFLGTRVIKHGIKGVMPKGQAGKVLVFSSVLIAAAIPLIASSNFYLQIAGTVLAAIGLTNTSPVVNGYTSDNTRQVADTVSAFMCASAIVTFFAQKGFGEIWELYKDQPLVVFIMPAILLAYLWWFGSAIDSKQLENPESRTIFQKVRDAIKNLIHGRSPLSSLNHESQGPDVNTPQPN